MLLKHRKGRLPLIIGIVLVLLLSLLTINKQQLLQSYRDANQRLMTMNLGYSDPANLPDPVVLNNTKLRNPAAIINVLPEIIYNKITGSFANSELERMDIDIKFTDYQTIMRDRKQSINNNFLTNPSNVNAKIRYHGEVYKVKLRLKGNLLDHWLSRYQMSLRVSVKDKKTIHGFNKFSLHKAGSRQHPYDQTFHALMRNSGNLSAVHDYVNIFVNGVAWGVMNIQEHMTKIFLEKLQRKESAIFRFSNKSKLLPYTMAAGGIENHYSGYRIYDSRFNVKVFGSRKELKNPMFRKWYSYISEQRLKEKHTHIYDVTSYSRALILAAAWNNAHTLSESNTKNYFNPYTLRLEPITTDQGEFEPLPGDKGVNDIIDPPYMLAYSQIILTDQYKEELDKNLTAMIPVISNIEDVLESYHNYFPLDQRKDGSIVIDNLNKIVVNKNKFLLPGLHESATDIKPPLIPSSKQASIFEEHLHIRHYDDGRLQLFNLLPDKVRITQILFNSKPILDKGLTVLGYEPGEYIPKTIQTDYKGIHDGAFEVKTEYQGNSRSVKSGVTLLAEDMVNPLLADTPTNLTYLHETSEGNWEIPKGNWFIKNPLTINGNLVIHPGARLHFADDTYLIVKGSLVAIGSESKSIILEPIGASWKGIFVLEGSKKSQLRNVIIRKTSELEVGLLKLTAGTTFYNTEVELHNVFFDGTVAEDALNVVNSSFLFDQIKIHSTNSDALDFDFSHGIIRNSFFSGIGGDALDFSGSEVEIKDATIRNVRDKAVSVGEASNVNIANSNFTDIGVGIASKDGSNVDAKNVNIDKYKLHAAMTFVKKDFYGIPSLNMDKCNVDEGKVNAFSRQIGTMMIVDGAMINEEKINVKMLYKNGIMKK